MRVIGPVALLAALLVVAFLLGRKRESDPAPSPPPPPPSGKAGFVGSETCKSCHEDRHATWLETAHAYSLRDAGPESVSGRFDGATVDAKYFTATPYMREGRYYVRVAGKDGRPSGDHLVTRVVGRAFEQAYLYTDARGEWRVLPICWSIERKEWDQTHQVLADIAGNVAPSETDDTRTIVFNNGCGQCHATDYDVGYNEAEGTYASRMLEGAVACESCHGPGSLHVAWHREERGAEAVYERPHRLLNPRRDLDARGVMDSCGRCHYLHLWRHGIDEDPTVSFHDIAVSMNFDGSQFFADGRINGLAYEGTVQSQSACYLKGNMSCLSCHRMHGGKRWSMKWEESEDAQCTQCHDEPQYTTASREHTRHQEVRCVDCHMPKFLSGVLHTARDHLIGNPEPELTERFGAAQAPNACGVCHTDQSPAWAREWKETWWRPAPRRIVEDVGLMVDLRRGGAVATEALAQAAERRESRNFFRITAIRNLGGRLQETAARAALRRLLADPDLEIRQQACIVLARSPMPEDAPAFVALLTDEARSTRIEAAFALARGGWHAATPEYRSVYADAEAMLVRQRGFEDTLERLAMIADAAMRPADFDRHLNALIRMVQRPQGPESLPALLHRRGRNQTEAGRHAEALETYASVFRLAGTSVLLVMDSADSLAEAGKASEAAGNWLHLREESPVGSLPWLVARFRLAAFEGQELAEARAALTAEVERLSAIPAAGELARRGRWSLRALP